MRKRGDIFKILNPPPLVGAYGRLIKESPVTGSLTLELLEMRGRFAKGERVIISAGDWQYVCAAPCKPR